MNGPFFDPDYDRIDALWDGMLERMHGDGMEQMRLRRLLATRPEFSDLSNLSDADIRAQVAQLRTFGNFSTTGEPEQHARPSVQATTVVPVVAAATAARAPVTEEKRYTLIAALTYKFNRLLLNRAAAFRCKLENEFTGSETRRSGPIKPSDTAYYDVRRREMRAGDYTLALTRPPCAARKLKALRAKP